MKAPIVHFNPASTDAKSACGIKLAGKVVWATHPADVECYRCLGTKVWGVATRAAARR